MDTTSLHLMGIGPVGPEEFFCIALQPAGVYKVVPMWVGEEEGREALAFVSGLDITKRGATETLIDLLESLGGVDGVTVVSYHQGEFILEISCTNGSSVECNPAVGVVVAHHFVLDIEISAEILAQVATYASPEDVEEYFGMEYATPEAKPEKPAQGGAAETSASGDSLADADFEAMMRSLGVDESDLDYGGEEK